MLRRRIKQGEPIVPIRRPTRLAAAFWALALLAGPAAAQMQQGADPGTNPADKAFIDAMRDGMVGMHQNMPTGDTDQDFVRLILPQNNAASELAKVELQYGKNADLKKIAGEIVATRDREVAQLKGWLDKHASH